MEFMLSVIGAGLFFFIVRGDFTEVIERTSNNRVKRAETKARVAEANAEAEKAKLERVKIEEAS